MERAHQSSNSMLFFLWRQFDERWQPCRRWRRRRRPASGKGKLLAKASTEKRQNTRSREIYVFSAGSTLFFFLALHRCWYLAAAAAPIQVLLMIVFILSVDFSLPIHGRVRRVCPFCSSRLRWGGPSLATRCGVYGAWRFVFFFFCCLGRRAWWKGGKSASFIKLMQYPKLCLLAGDAVVVMVGRELREVWNRRRRRRRGVG